MEESPRTPPPPACRPLRPTPGGVRVVRNPFTEAKPEGWTRFVCFSDTHGKEADIPAEHHYCADVLLHAGDFTNTGELREVAKFAEWLRDYPAAHKFVIAGNHDITFEPSYYEKAWKRFHREPQDCAAARRALTESGSCTYLEDGAAEVLGYQIYGSPWQPEFCDWAFNRRRGDALRTVWDKIPEGTDILITHGPPFGKGDQCREGSKRAGCLDLLCAVQRRAIPISLSGHIHEGHGVRSDGTTLFVNASTCTTENRPENLPVVLDVPPARELHEAFGRLRARARNLAGRRADAHDWLPSPARGKRLLFAAPPSPMRPLFSEDG